MFCVFLIEKWQMIMRADISPDGNRFLLLMDTRNTRGVINVLSAFGRFASCIHTRVYKSTQRKRCFTSPFSEAVVLFRSSRLVHARVGSPTVRDLVYYRNYTCKNYRLMAFHTPNPQFINSIINENAGVVR